MKAYLKRVRISPKKANLVACLIRGKNATEALDILKFTPKRAAGILHKLLKSAIANAEHNSKQDKDKLVVKEVVVTQGPTYKRSIPISRGRVHPILKRTSHIRLSVETTSPATPEKTETSAKTETTAKKETTTKKKAPTKKATTKKTTKDKTDKSNTK